MKLAYIFGAILILLNISGIIAVNIYEHVRKETIKTKIINSTLSALLFIFTAILITVLILKKEIICIIFLFILVFTLSIVKLISSILELLDQLNSKKDDK